ncbi:MAG: hypothetical protein ACOX3T_01010 [Bdellovibrionota bacterium]
MVLSLLSKLCDENKEVDETLSVKDELLLLLDEELSLDELLLGEELDKLLLLDELPLGELDVSKICAVLKKPT